MQKNTVRVISNVPLVLVMIFSLALTIGIACSRQATTTRAQKTSPSAGIPMRLNQQDVGSNDNTSQLENALRQLFEERKKNRVFRSGTTEPLNTVYLWPEETLKISEIAKVSTAIRRKADGRTLLYVPLLEKPLGHLHADPLQLTLFIGTPKSPAPVIWQDDTNSMATDPGINLIFDLNLILKSTDPPDEYLEQLIEVPKDGEYLIGRKPLDGADLRETMRERMKGARPFAFVFVGSDVSWSSLAKVGEAADAAGIGQLTVGSLVP